MPEQTAPEVRTIEEGVPWTQPRHFDMTTEAGARTALAKIASTGTQAEKKAVRDEAAKAFPNIAKGLFPNSNMNP